MLEVRYLEGHLEGRVLEVRHLEGRVDMLEAAHLEVQSTPPCSSREVWYNEGEDARQR